jgi:hypothetical protein
MKKVVAICLLASSVQAFANTFNPFLTIEDAAKNCPPATELTFKPKNSLPNSSGLVEGFNSDNIFFESLQAMLHPVQINGVGYIKDATLRETNGMYGYNSNETITCFYSYTAFDGQKIFSNLRSKV